LHCSGTESDGDASVKSDTSHIPSAFYQLSVEQIGLVGRWAYIN